MCFVVAPAICLFLSLVLGWILSAVEDWEFSEGFWYVSAKMAGMRNPFVAKSPKSTHGVIWDLFISVLGIVFSSTVVGMAGMLAFVSNLPEKLQLGTLRRGVLALFVGVPICICATCFVSGAFMAWAEEWSLLGTTCGLGNPLTTVNPAEWDGRLLAVI